MTHDELLTLLKEYAEQAGFRMDRNCWFILSSVVELHKPTECYDGCCLICKYCTNDDGIASFYPCHTIQAIEKELS